MDGGDYVVMYDIYQKIGRHLETDFERVFR
jgi:hypothetical protein